MNPSEIAVLLTGRAARTFGISNELLPLLGQPMLQRALEALVRAGSRQIHVLLGEETLDTRQFLGDGARWGCELVYHHTRRDETLGGLARRLRLTADQRYLLADAARMPGEADILFREPLPPGIGGRIWTVSRGDSEHWVGWGEFPGAWLSARCEPLSQAELEPALLASTDLVRSRVAAVWSAATAPDLLETAIGLLAAAGPITQGRGCKIHPSAILRAPVHLGRNVRIGAGAVVGPNAVVGDGVLLERDVLVEHAVIQPNTYVGEGLELRHALVGGSRLANVRLDTVVEVANRDLLSPIRRATDGRSPGWAERTFALALRALLSPLWVAAGLCAGRTARPSSFLATEPAYDRRAPVPIDLSMTDPQSARLAGGDWDLLRHFRNSFYPGLTDVSAGRLRLAGPTARDPKEVAQLPVAWRDLYATTRCGLVNETLLQGPEAVLPEHQFAGDALASATQEDPVLTRRLVRGYLGAVVRHLARSSIRTFRHNRAGAGSHAHRRTA